MKRIGQDNTSPGFVIYLFFLIFKSDIRWWLSLSFVSGSLKAYLIADVGGMELPQNTRGGYGVAWAEEFIVSFLFPSGGNETCIR